MIKPTFCSAKHPVIKIKKPWKREKIRNMSKKTQWFSF